MGKEKNKIKTHNLIFLFIATTIIITTISLSKYVSTVSTDSITKVALMANDLSVDIDLTEGVYPGYKTIRPITFTNENEEGMICDVAQQFTLQFGRETIENIPINFSIYKDVLCTEIIEPDENGYYSSEDFKLNAGERDEKTYFLEISWPEEENEEQLAFEIGYFTMNIIVEQVN